MLSINPGGLGVAIGKALRSKGYNLALLYAPFEADKVDSTLSSNFGDDGHDTAVHKYCCDITSDLSVQEAFSAIDNCLSASSGKVLPSILINTAGYVSLHPLETTPTEEIVKHLHVNLLGPILVAQAFAKLYFTYSDKYKDAMPPGRIVNIASQAAHVALAQHGSYCASKAGLVGATRSMASEWGPRGITANSISPGPVMTDLGKKAWGADDVREA